MACPNEYNEIAKQDEKLRSTIDYALREGREGYTVKKIPKIIGLKN